MKLLTGASLASELIFLSLGSSLDYTGLVNIIVFSEGLISFLVFKITVLTGALSSYSREDLQVVERRRILWSYADEGDASVEN